MVEHPSGPFFQKNEIYTNNQRFTFYDGSYAWVAYILIRKQTQFQARVGNGNENVPPP